MAEAVASMEWPCSPIRPPVTVTVAWSYSTDRGCLPGVGTPESCSGTGSGRARVATDAQMVREGSNVFVRWRHPGCPCEDFAQLALRRPMVTSQNPTHFRPDAATASCSRARSGAHSAACTLPGAKRISRRIHETSLEYSASRRLWLARFLVQTRV